MIVMVDDKYKELTDLFIANFESFQSIEEPGGSDAANAIVAAGLAKSIIDALPSSRLNVVGEKTVAEINVYEKVAGDLFTVTDSGVLAGSEPLIVNRGWLVWWDGQKFVKVYEGGSSVTVDQALDITSANPIANAPVAAAIVDVNRRIDEIEPGVQSDWAQDDSASPDYIKNKPEIPAEITVDSALSPSSTNPVQNKAVYNEFTWKINRVPSAAEGNLPTFNAYGSITDSGKKPSDFATSTQGSHADSAYGWGDHAQQGYLKSADIIGKADKVSGATNGNLAALNAAGNLVDSGKSSDGIIYTTVVPEHNFAAGSEKWVGLGYFPISSTWKSVTLIVNRDYYGIQKRSSDIFGVALDNSAGNRYIIRRVAVHNGGNQSAYGWKTKVVGSNVWLLCQDDYGQMHSRFEVTIIGAGESFVVSPDYTVTTAGAVDVAIGGHVAEAEKATADGNGDEISTTYAKNNDLSGKQNVDGSNATSAGMSTAINKLATGSEDFKDTDIVIGSNHSGSVTDTSTFVRRTFLNLYNRIKTKLDSVYAALGHTHSVKINGSAKTIAASGGTAVDLGDYDTSGAASSAVSTHNSSSSAHSSLLAAKADNTPTFSQASTRANLAGSGETMPTILGKIKKFFSDLKTVAFTGSYSDLSGKPTIPAAANNATLTVKMNGANIGTFTANASADETINLGTVLTQHQDISGKIEVAWKEFGRMVDMTASERRAVYEEIAELMGQVYISGAKVLPCIRSGEGCFQFPYEGGYPQRGYIYFAGIFGYTDPNKVIIQTTILHSDGRYEERRLYLTNKADKPNTYTSGHFASLDSDGNLADSGKAPSDFESSDFSRCQENASGKWYKVATITQKGTNAYCLMCAKIEIMAGDNLFSNNSSHMSNFATYDLMIRRNGTSNQHPSGASGNTFLIKKNILYGMESVKISAGFVSKFSGGKLSADIWVKGNADSTSNYSNNVLARVVFAGCGMDTTDKGVTVTYYDRSSGSDAPDTIFREATRKVIAATSA